MIHARTPALLLAILAPCLLSCASTPNVLDEEQSVKLRQIQTRAFDATNREKTLRTVIATLQDLSFVIDEADLDLGTVSATKLERYRLRMTVSVRPRGRSQLLVRANAQYNVTPVHDPEPYQQFFATLEKSMFLTAHSVE